jgi:phosphoenolpyruvate-protein phosphotransferase
VLEVVEALASRGLRFRGVVVSPGIAIGSVLVLREVDVLERVGEEKSLDIEGEVRLLHEACLSVKRKLESLKLVLPRAEQEIIDAQLLIVDSLVSEAEELVRGSSLSAASAVKRVYEKYSEMLRSGGELFALRTQDLHDIAVRLVSCIVGGSAAGVEWSGKILVAEEIDPIRFLEAVDGGLVGLVTRRGGLTAHVSILARLRGVPYLISRDLDLGALRNNASAVLDCVNGYFNVELSPGEVGKYYSLVSEYRETVALYAQEEKLEPVTRDGVRIAVMCNTGNLEEVRVAPSYGCGGVGLFRIEFAYMARDAAPAEDELFNLFKRSLEFLGGGPLTVRAPDIGGDKPVRFLELPREANPQLGFRGTRLLLRYRDLLLRPLVRAALRAAVFGDLRLMFPMVSVVEEVEELVEIVKEEEERMRGEGCSVKMPMLGVMVEVPSAALLVGELIDRGGLSFVSFGTNDLTQYVLAADRTSAYVSDIYDELNPSVLRLMSYAIDRIRGRAEVEVCGEMASRGLAVPVLLGLGVRGLSVAPGFVGKVKYVVRRLDYGELAEVTRGIVEGATTAREVREWLQSYLKSRGVKVFE